MSPCNSYAGKLDSIRIQQNHTQVGLMANNVNNCENKEIFNNARLLIDFIHVMIDVVSFSQTQYKDGVT